MKSEFEYSRWRHGGWYVHNVRYPSGAIGCVSRNYEDRKWRIVCDPRPFDERPTFPNRDAAARAEMELALWEKIARDAGWQEVRHDPRPEYAHLGPCLYHEGQGRAWPWGGWEGAARDLGLSLDDYGDD